MSRFLNSAGIYTETVTITTAGIAQNPTTMPVPEGVKVLVRAHPSNTGYIKVAETAAKAQSAYGTNNTPLETSQGASWQITDPALLYIDATVSGEKAIVSFEK